MLRIIHRPVTRPRRMSPKPTHVHVSQATAMAANPSDNARVRRGGHPEIGQATHRGESSDLLVTWLLRPRRPWGGSAARNEERKASTGSRPGQRMPRRRHIQVNVPMRNTARSTVPGKSMRPACAENPVCAVTVPPAIIDTPASAPTQPSHFG